MFLRLRFRKNSITGYYWERKKHAPFSRNPSAFNRKTKPGVASVCNSIAYAGPNPKDMVGVIQEDHGRQVGFIGKCDDRNHVIGMDVQYYLVGRHRNLAECLGARQNVACSFIE